jgi:hypothetical protein
MSLNCKPNTLAVFTRQLPVVDTYTGQVVQHIDLRGKIVTTVCLKGEARWLLDPPPEINVSYKDHKLAGLLLAVGDEYLRALEDKPGDDESLSWKCGLPKKKLQQV